MMHNHRKELIQVNRARGLELISPDDLLLGAKALAEVNNEHVLALIYLSELLSDCFPELLYDDHHRYFYFRLVFPFSCTHFPRV